jgi:hypothetical protein
VNLPRRLWSDLRTEHLPVQLEAWEWIDQEAGTGMAGIGDAMLRGFKRQGDAESI